MTERVPRLGFGRVPEETADVGIAFDVGAPREVQVSTVRLRLAPNASFRFSWVLVPFSAFAMASASEDGNRPIPFKACTRNDS